MICVFLVVNELNDRSQRELKMFCFSQKGHLDYTPLTHVEFYWSFVVDSRQAVLEEGFFTKDEKETYHHRYLNS